MSDTKHTPEPWALEEVGDKCKHLCPAKDGTSILTVALEYPDDYDDDEPVYFGAVYKPADARRIVACVNACKQYTNDELEYGMIEKEREAVMAWERAMMAAIGGDGIKSVTEAIAKLKAERDELLAALKIIYNRHLNPGPATGEDAIFCFRRALAAIDKVGGAT